VAQTVTFLPLNGFRSRSGLLRFPTDQRELLQMLGMLETSAAPDAVLDRIDLFGARPAHVYHVAHRRLPDSIEAAMAAVGYDARAALAAAVTSDEFRANVVLNLLHAWPELGRSVVLGVPGVRLDGMFTALAKEQSVLRDRLGVPDHEPPLRFLEALARQVRALPHGGDLVVECAATMERYMARVGHRPRDTFLIVIDDPVRVLAGRACDAVAQLHRDPEANAMRTREIIEGLGGIRSTLGLGVSELRRLAERALLSPLICRPNLICATLSQTGGSSFADALATAAIMDVEITTRADLPAWLLQRCGVVMLPEAVTEPLITEEAVIDHFAEHALAMTEHDRRFYELVTFGLSQTGQPGIAGQELVRVAGREALQMIAARSFVPSAREAFPARAERATLPDALAAIGDADVLAFLREQESAQGEVISFGASGTSQIHTGAGWSAVERDARWTNARVAAVTLPWPQTPGPHWLRIDVTPFTAPGWPSQRVGIMVNGRPVAIVCINARAVLKCPIPFSLPDQSKVEVNLTLPDAASPLALGVAEDSRMLGLYVREMALLSSAPKPKPPLPQPPPATPRRERPDPMALKTAELAIQFESIGENCEFGLVQRRWGAEPLGLLRFASAPPDKLLAALRDGFQGMGSRGNLEVQLGSSNEYMVHDKRFGFLYHAWAKVGELTPDEILVREHRRVPFLIRKLAEEMASGDKLFVYHAMRPLAQPEAETFASLLRAKGGETTLLWLELADRENPAGSVIRIDDQLLKGHMDRFAPGENAHDISLDCWEMVCRNALRVMWGAPT